jgi:hypothetical protein
MKMYGRVKVISQGLTLTLDGRERSESRVTFLSPKAEPKVGNWLSPVDSNFSVAKKKMFVAGWSRAPV